MTYRDFCFWLQGCFEVTNPETLSREQLTIIKRHLDMVFVHERGEATMAVTKREITPPAPKAMC